MAHTGEAGTSSSGRKTCDIKGLVKCQNCQRVVRYQRYMTRNLYKLMQR